MKAFAKHVFGVEWDYHHNLGMINHTSFLLNYLSDVLDGAKSYSEWMNGDLYERTTEQFGICEFPGKHHRDAATLEPIIDVQILTNNRVPAYKVMYGAVH